MMLSYPILGITGATGVGKSEVAVKIAQTLGSQIVSADSMQIYKYMDIGTAKLSKEQMHGITHHMIDIVTPDKEFSSFLYEQKVSEILPQMTTVPIIAGGTGFYFDSLLFPSEFGDEEATKQIRKVVQTMLEEKGVNALLEVLETKDKATFETIDKNNIKRVTRAVEIVLSGQKKSDGKGKNRDPQYEMVLFVLTKDRELLYDGINRRVDKMIECGLLDEAQFLLKKFGRLNTSAFSAIGYKECFDYLEGLCTLNQAVEKIKLNTRHYCKRQLTYFKRMNVYQTINIENYNFNTDSIAEEIILTYNNYLNRKQ